MTRNAIAIVLLLGLAGCSREAAPPGDSMRTAAPTGPRVYVSNEMSGTVSVVDPASRQVVATITVGKRPRGIRASADGKTIFVALSGSPVGGPGVDESKLPPPDRQHDGIGVIDVATGRLTRVLNGGTDPEQFVISADGRRLFIANEDAGLTTVLDVDTGEIVKQVEVGGEPEGVDISPDGRFVYVTAEADNQVFAIDTSSLDVAKVIDVGARPRSTGFLPGDSRAYVSAENDASLTVVDTATHSATGRIELPGEPRRRPMGVIAAPDGRHVFVTTGRGGTLARIDTATGTVSGEVPVGERPWGVAISPDGRQLYTANGPSNDITIVDVASWTVIGKVPVGERPWGVVVIP